ncbi:hypothetical protein C4B38_000069 [Diabrotica virgifera virgifera]|uniref:Probable cytochrome P450 6a13 n=1 Tax=Diabrotica virgifera virgifera TaxID=50390 RepID=A0A6P7F9A9_DIAVI|nr:hypothetical protein C4B38_000069 [Diabrotica virgifera virgifera]
MSIVTNSSLINFLIVIATIVFTATIYIKYKYSYWKRKGIVQLKPTFPYGNHGSALPRGIALGRIVKRFYDEFKKQGLKVGGVYMGLSPYLVVVDPEYAKNILTTDFQYFTDRGIYINKNNPISVNILSQEGAEWRESRAKFTNIFTSAKMKYFFETLKRSSEELRTSLKQFVDSNKDLDIFEMIACYTTDIIGDVIYGIEAGSFKPEGAIIRRLGNELFGQFTLLDQLKLFITICYPGIAKILNISQIQEHIGSFFIKFFKDAMEYREANNIKRADFLELLIEMKKAGVKLTDEEMGSQAFLFFAAGFETSSMSSSLTLMELALHQDIQDKVREEIHAALKKHNGQVSYEMLKELTLLDKAFNETVRRYPPLSAITRTCVKDYKFRNSDISIEKGTPVIFPLIGYHANPDYYPDPLKWDINRFQDKNEKHVGFYPFGDGPRNCIGSRFGIMQVRLGLVSVLRDYKVTVSPNTKLPLKFHENTFVTNTIDPVLLRIESVKKD